MIINHMDVHDDAGNTTRLVLTDLLFWQWLAYRQCGGEKTFNFYMQMVQGYIWYDDGNPRSSGTQAKLDVPHYDWSFFRAAQSMPDLVLHRWNGGRYDRLTFEAAEPDATRGNLMNLGRSLVELRRSATPHDLTLLHAGRLDAFLAFLAPVLGRDTGWIDFVPNPRNV